MGSLERSPQGLPEALSGTKNPCSEGEADISSTQERDPEELWQQERVQQVAEERFYQKNPSGTFLVKIQQAKEREQKQ